MIKPTETDYKLLLKKINIDNEYGHCEKLLESFAEVLGRANEIRVADILGTQTYNLYLTPCEIISYKQFSPRFSYLKLIEEIKKLSIIPYISSKQRNNLISWFNYGIKNKLIHEFDAKFWITELKLNPTNYISIEKRKNLLPLLIPIIEAIGKKIKHKAYLLYDGKLINIFKNMGYYSKINDSGLKLDINIPKSELNDFYVKFESFIKKNPKYPKNLFIISEEIICYSTHYERC